MRYHLEMNRIDVVTRTVTAFLVKNFLFDNAADAPAPTASLMQTGIVDSTGVLEIVAFLEGEYGFAVADDELLPANFDSVTAIAAFVVKKQEAA